MKVVIPVSDYPVTDDDIKELTENLLQRLRREGVDDSVGVRVTKFPSYSSEAVALYRGASQFKSRPIFWINNNPAPYEETIRDDKEALGYVLTTPQVAITDSLYHEYGHVVAEYLRYQYPDRYRELMARWETEENFAEDGMLRYLDNSSYSTQDENDMSQLLRWYGRDLRDKHG